MNMATPAGHIRGRQRRRAGGKKDTKKKKGSVEMNCEGRWSSRSSGDSPDSF